MDVGNDGHGAAQRLEATLHRVEGKVGDHGTNNKFEHGHASGDKVADGGVAMRKTQVAGVHACGGDRHIRLAGELLIAVEGAHGGLLTSLITVEGVDEFAAEVVVVEHEPAQKLQVLLTEGGSTGGDGSGHPGGMHGHDVGVSLHHHSLMTSGDVLFGAVQPEQHFRLFIQQRVRRVHVFAHVVVIEKLSRAEPNHITREIFDGPQQTPMKLVDGPATTHFCQPRRIKFLVAKSLTQQVFGQSVPPLGRITATELVCMIGRKTTLGEEVPRSLSLRGFQLCTEKLVGGLIRGNQPLPGSGFLPAARSPTFIVNAVANLLGANLHCLREGNMLHFHQKTEHIAALPRGEAVKVATVGPHMK